MVVPPHPVIYLLPSRPWLYDLGVQGLAAVPDAALDSVCRGVDVLWLQGAWEVGPAGRAHDLGEPGRRRHFEECLCGTFKEDDCIGSPYAITRYVLNPELGSEEDLASFRDRLRQRSVALMLDFVPNHTARDSPWTSKAGLHVAAEHGAAKGGPAFGRDPYSGDWTDTAQLNYWSDACRKHMTDVLADIAGRCDGVRIDMAMLSCNAVVQRTWGDVLRRQGFNWPKDEFWPRALARAREKRPGFLALAECYEYEEIFPQGTGQELLRQGFDAVYDKVTYDRLHEGHMDKLRWHLHGGNSPLVEGRLCHFTENHDEPRAASHFGGRAAAAAVASLSLPGPRMVMWGQEFGRRERLAVHLRRAVAEEADGAAVEFYSMLLDAVSSCRGKWAPLHVSGGDSWRFLAWSWQGDAAVVMVACNFTDGFGWANVHCGDILAPCKANGGNVKLTDALSGEAYERSLDELQGPQGLVVGLKEYSSHVFVCQR